MSDGVRCTWMRGGTSKGAFFLAGDLPADPAVRDTFLLRVMGSPDPRQIDGMGGGDPLTSKVAVVSRSQRAGVDVDFLFLQVFVDQALVADTQNCGNMLAGVGPFAIERGLLRCIQACRSRAVRRHERLFMRRSAREQPRRSSRGTVRRSALASVPLSPAARPA